jgi:FkbM family methyltransferase
VTGDNAGMALKSFTVRSVKLEIDERSLNRPLEGALESGRYESIEADAVEKMLKPGDIYLELGAGVGFTSTLAWRIVRDPLRIHAFEANPALIPVIRATWAANGADGQLYKCLLGKGQGERTFNVSKAFWASSAHIAYGSGREIVVEQRDFLKRATFLMMDIEGGEGDLLDETLPPLVRTIVAEYHPKIIGEERVKALWANLESQGFRFVPEASEGMVRACVR